MIDEKPAKEGMFWLASWPTVAAVTYGAGALLFSVPLAGVATLLAVGAGGVAAVSLMGDKETPYIDRLKSNFGRIGKLTGFVGHAFSSFGADIKDIAGALNGWAVKEEAEDKAEARVDAAIAAETGVAEVSRRRLPGFGVKTSAPANQDAKPAPARTRGGPSAG